jgi:tetratricopeptide (TPR) repeat protein
MKRKASNRNKGAQVFPAKSVGKNIPATNVTEQVLQLYNHQNYQEVLDVVSNMEPAVKNKCGVEVFNAAALSAEMVGSLDLSVEYWRKALEIKPNVPDAHNNLGVVLERLKLYVEAEEEYRRALFLKLNLAEAHYNLAGLLRRTSRGDLAELSYRQALAYKPEYTDAKLSLATLLLSKWRFIEGYKVLWEAFRAGKSL